MKPNKTERREFQEWWDRNKQNVREYLAWWYSVTQSPSTDSESQEQQ